MNSFSLMNGYYVRNNTTSPQPPSVEDYSGKVQQYKVWTDQKQEFSCPAASNKCTVKVSEVAQALSISAVTLYGASPPADLPLKHSGSHRP